MPAYVMLCLLQNKNIGPCYTIYNNLLVLFCTAPIGTNNRLQYTQKGCTVATDHKMQSKKEETTKQELH